MEKIIVNADDCGKNKLVDAAIEKCINAGEITSTSIMANMDDFKGALDLYNRYSNCISFGFHVNLTEGAPLTNQRELTECGIAEFDEDGKLKLCGNKQRKHYYSRNARKAIKNEIEAQISRLENSGIKISHIDSHHHIHTDFWVLIVVLKVAKEHNIDKIRGISNYTSRGISLFARTMWRRIVKLIYPSIHMTDYFTSFNAFVNNKVNNTSDGTIELMTHPGGYEPEEAEIISNNIESLKPFMINYNQL